MAGDRALAVPTQDEHCPQPCQGRWPRCGPISCLDPADSRPSLPSICATWDRDQPSGAGSHGSEEERVVGASGGRAATTVYRAPRGLSTRPVDLSQSRAGAEGQWSSSPQHKSPRASWANVLSADAPVGTGALPPLPTPVRGSQLNPRGQ